MVGETSSASEIPGNGVGGIIILHNLFLNNRPGFIYILDVGFPPPYNGKNEL
jgi:hypothetical protein